MNEFIRSQWAKSKRSLAAAEATLDTDPDSAASRAYYAAFHGVTAVLAWRGMEFTKNTAVRAALHRDLIQSGAIPVDLGGYLLNPLHPVGGPKASWFLMLGYQTEVPELLAADLLKIVGNSDDFDSLPGSFGVKYGVRGVLRTPSGRLVPLQSIWMIEKRSDAPRLVSAYPARSQSDAEQGT